MTPGQSLYFAHLAYPHAEELLGAEHAPVLFLPVGATEPHGPHAPLATDAIISQAMCERAAERLAADEQLRGLVLPAIPFGVTRYAQAFPGIVHVDETTLSALIGDVCRSLFSQGFDNLVVANSHFEPDHVATLHNALDQVEREDERTVGFLDLTRRERAQRLTEAFRRGESHADRYETSIVLAARPELVDIDTMKELPYLPINMAKAIAAGKNEFEEIGLTRAYAGAPSEASAEEGNATLDLLAEMLIECARAIVDGTGGRDQPGLFGRA